MKRRHLQPLPPPLFVYFAGSYVDRLTLLGRAREIESISVDLDCPIKITSSWLLGEHEAKDGDASISEMGEWGMKDIADIQAASVLIQFTSTPSTAGGMHVELGIALLGGGKQVAVCGPVTNPFQAVPWVEKFDQWPACREWLLARAIGHADQWKEKSA